jgi:hypothetical protein
MKKQFQILNIAIAICLVSCGKHNAEISGTVTNGAKEFSAHKSSTNGEPDLLLIDHEGRIRFNAEGDHQVIESEYNLSVVSNSSKNTRSQETKLLID